MYPPKAYPIRAVHFQRDTTVDSTKGSLSATLTTCFLLTTVDTRESMFATLLTCLMLVTVLSPVVEGDCTVVINGANEPGTKGDPRPQAGGVVYTRWGRMVCPQGSTLVYAGRAAGTKYNVKGGTSDTLCMPETPQYLSTDTTATYAALLRGVEFETPGTSSTPLNNVYHANLPCAVCHTDTKLSALTVPAQYTCPNGHL